jgi:hypothetical protein
MPRHVLTGFLILYYIYLLTIRYFRKIWILKIIKQIQSFFLLLAAISFAVHMIIPHDHHLPGMTGGLKSSCHQSHDRSHHRPLFPAHCHAFNDLAAEKHTPLIIKQDTQNSFASIIWYPDYVIPYLQLTFLLFENTGKPFLDIYIPDFSPFRAPPALS